MIERSEIISEVEKELDFVLTEAPDSLSEAARKEIMKESIDYTERILDAVSSAELQSESALERFIETIVAEARMKIHQRSR